MNMIEQLRAEIQSILEQDIITQQDVARIGRLEAQLNRAYIVEDY